MTSLSLSDSRQRATVLDVTSYDVHLDLTGVEHFGSRSTIRFAARETGAETFVEIADALSVRATLNGVELPAGAWADGRITLTDLAEHNELVVDATLPYVTNGDGMHRFVDPADGETYVSAYCGMDIASRVFACFDQPDLKATVTLTVDADPRWTVLANGQCTLSGEGHWSFATTPPISPYLFVVCAGPWHSVTFEHRGLPFGWHARQSLATELERDADELRRITTSCFDHLTATFDEPYAFDSYDQVMVPGLNWGAMEMPGCITFDDGLLFRGTPSAMQAQHRAMVIAHEMAHMWFGDLVTMKWWEDSWLSESFADYMGYQVAGAAAGFTDGWIACAVNSKPSGYRADERRSTHPVAEDAEAMVDVDTAFGNFDMITYAKGNAVLRQLVTWLGEDTFVAGANAYLTRHGFGNAELADFLEALDSVSDRDVRAWAQVWLRQSGFDTILVSRDGGVPVLTCEGGRPHRLTVTGYADSGEVVGSRLVDLADEPVPLPEFAGLAVVANSGDETFARVRPDPQSWAFVVDRLSHLEDPLTRAVLWHTAVDMTRTGDLRVPDLFALVAAHLAAEPHPMVFEGALVLVREQVLARLVAPAQLEEAAGVVSAVATLVLADGWDGPRAVAAAQALAATTTDVALLEEWLSSGQTAPGHPLDPDLRWSAVRRLVELGADPSVIDRTLEQDPSASGEIGALRARAAVPTPEAKAAAWALVYEGEPSNREFRAVNDGFWTSGQHDLVDAYLDRYVEAGPEVARRRGQAFSKGVGHSFPVLPLPLPAMERLRDGVTGALADSTAGVPTGGVPTAAGVPTVLHREWSDRLDDLTLALHVRSRTVDS
ncbi:aminopeptidase N [Nocardioides sp. Root151]|uniref:aminopeptidase N n=1 Tax=Nocardioides sp. Root151 TaxID=1736475 RepID=UPI0007030572|nr:aminopeptidase N [Nocardioides sp. Root151]KQZ67238.1 hypothetical protein ASD66_19920 [Nocardioides sp. Root151]